MSFYVPLKSDGYLHWSKIFKMVTAAIFEKYEISYLWPHMS